MLQLARWRIILVAMISAIGFLTAMPNLLPETVREQVKPFLMSQPINLGLDLRGGSQLLLQIDIDKMREQQLNNVTDSMTAALREAKPAILFSALPVADGVAKVRLNDASETDRAMAALRAGRVIDVSSGQPNLALTSAAGGIIEARFNDRALNELARQSALQSIEVIRKRIDPNGTSEVTILPQGNDRIVVQAPGVSDPQVLRERIGKTALMTFHQVNDSYDAAAVQAGRIPPGYMLSLPYPGVGERDGHPFEIVRRRASLTGEHVTKAFPSIDPNSGRYVLSFALDSAGGHTFCTLTRNFTGQRFAILLDGQFLTAPTIHEPICAGSGQITGNFNVETANELALMIRAGALPAPLNVIEQRSVGPEVGKEAIDAGAHSTLYAAIGVVIFMVLFYGLFGFLACVALVVNMSMIVGAMSVWGAVLTLPGIAGLVLTIGMAVDANVLIYERMREEAAHGRAPAVAIDAGFARAMLTIIDSHLTQFLAALILFWFGAGPVRGFAWTLSIGCITSVLTATFVTQFLIAFWFRLVRPKKLPI